MAGSPHKLRIIGIRVMLAIFAVVGSLLIAAGSAEAAAYYNLMIASVNGWTLYNQQHNNWCWAGSAQIGIQRIKGTSPSQCDIVKFTKSSPDCLDGTNLLSGLTRTFTNWGVPSSYSASPLTFPTASSLNSNGGGALSQIDWTKGGAHVTTIIGSTSQGTVTVYNIQTQSVSSYATMPWATYSSGSSALFSGTYKLSVFIGVSK